MKGEEYERKFNLQHTCRNEMSDGGVYVTMLWRRVVFGTMLFNAGILVQTHMLWFLLFLCHFNMKGLSILLGVHLM